MERAATEAAHMSAPDHGPHRSRRFLLLLKGRPHMSQTLPKAAEVAERAPLSDFVNLWETETDRQQPVLLAHRPGARKGGSRTAVMMDQSKGAAPVSDLRPPPVVGSAR